eukprot:10750507-Alexandrium_andersonii.AAC.1
MVAMAAGPEQVQSWSPHPSRGSFCAVVRAERGCGNENLRTGSGGLVPKGFGAERGGNGDNGGHGGRKQGRTAWT